jgi:hypothetical protein
VRIRKLHLLDPLSGKGEKRGIGWKAGESLTGKIAGCDAASQFSSGVFDSPTANEHSTHYLHDEVLERHCGGSDESICCTVHIALCSSLVSLNLILNPEFITTLGHSVLHFGRTYTRCLSTKERLQPRPPHLFSAELHMKLMLHRKALFIFSKVQIAPRD